MIAVAEGDRSCIATLSDSSPLHILGSSQHRDGAAAAALRCGSQSNPWIVEAQIGQQINVSLLDFGRRAEDIVARDQMAASSGSRSHDCALQYGYILDKSATVNKNKTVCASSAIRSTEMIHQSQGNTVELVLAPLDSQTGNSSTTFLIAFQGMYHCWRDMLQEKKSISCRERCNFSVRIFYVM